MERVATHRLIEAAATLDPASRALLNLTMHRGLSDVALARMAGIGTEALVARRLDLIDQLSARLGLPPLEILAAVSAISKADPPAFAPPRVSATPRATRPTTSAARPAGGPAIRPARSEPPRAVEPPPPTPVAPSPVVGVTVPSLRARRPSWLSRAAFGHDSWRWGPVLALLFIAILLLVLWTSSPAVTPRAPTPKPTAPVAGHGIPRAASRLLTPLPGVSDPAHGTVAAVGNGPRLGLTFTVTGLPRVTRGYYEVWLYNSIIDSVPLGRVQNGARLTVRVPRGAGAYRWIDISFEPPGDANNSGESVLRTNNPVRAISGAAQRP